VLASIGTVGDALDNALAESFVDSYKTELIADRVWRTLQQLELATVEWVAWFNHQRLHEALGDIPPVEYEQLHGPEVTSRARFRSTDRSRRPGRGPQRGLERVAARRSASISPSTVRSAPPTLQSSERYPLRPRHQQVDDESAPCGLSDE
jgi:Integrase core domain